MEVNNPHNQSYWFVVREDQSNVIFSSNNFTIQNPQIAGQETRYIVDTSDDRQYIQINDAPLTLQEDTSEHCEKEVTQLPKEDENFWDRNKIKSLLTLCLENRYRISNHDKTLWEEIAAVIGSTAEECDKKYRNLRRTYIRLLKKKRLGKDIKWVHYNLCEEVFVDCKSLSPSMLEPWEDTKIRRLLNLYIENINRFRSTDCLQKEVWKDIATELATTEYNCYHKFKNLKRTYFNWLHRSRETGKVIKWPYHHYFERIFYNYNPNIGPWNRTKIKLLIDAYAQIAHKFRNPKFQKKELWKEISSVVGESPNNCDRKFRNLKQTYIRLKMRAEAGGSITKWRYYKDFEVIYENPRYSTMDDGIQKYIYKSEDQDYIKQLLTYYLEHKEKFRNPFVKKKTLWRVIGPKIGLSSDECDKKFRNLKQTYIRLMEKKRQTGKGNNWPYYTYFEQIYNEPKSLRDQQCNHLYSIDNATLTTIKRSVQNACDFREKDKFEKLVQAIEDSNNIQRERNRILQALLNKR
ncbi:uncharacterized protein [Epargyreus clarus]|uniref:uncharacterized protein n=1 Tax=Epargyreus clarus TaxID=520877 RepID=UPI003C2FEAFE